MNNMIRVVMIGKAGVGKSSLGNTLLGDNLFRSSTGGDIQTMTCATEIRALPNGKVIKVVDTPGFIDERGISEVKKSILYLSPGPHAFLIVLQPGRATIEERKAIRELPSLFGDKSFLNYAVIVMVRKNDIKSGNNDPVEIHDYIKRYAAEEIKELYQLCGGRIVAVENNASSSELEKYALDVMAAIEQIGGHFYSLEHFRLMERLKITEEQLKTKDEKIKDNDSCTVS